MDAVEAVPLKSGSLDSVKANVTTEETTIASDVSTVCYKSNGKPGSSDVDSCSANDVPIKSSTWAESDLNKTTVIEATNVTLAVTNISNNNNEAETTEPIEDPTPTQVDVPVPSTDVETEVASQSIDEVVVLSVNQNDGADSAKVSENVPEVENDPNENIVCNEVEVPAENITVEIKDTPITSESVTFKTEIVVEKNGQDNSILIEVDMNGKSIDEHDATSILNDLTGQNIELSEVLRSSDVSDSAENNNCTTREEVFNNEELLDILEGKEPSESQLSHDKKDGLRETQLALQQLSRLQTTRKSADKDKNKIKGKRNVGKLSAKTSSGNQKKTPERSDRDNINRKKQKKITDSFNSSSDTESIKKKPKPKPAAAEDDEKVPKKPNIVNALVQDWEDDDIPDAEQVPKLRNECEELIKAPESLEQAEEVVTKEEDTSRASLDSTLGEESTTGLNKSGDESQPQRRIGRVIKKKVIFDPDNPDTFTKGKTPTKKDLPHDKNEQIPIMKSKIEQTVQRSKSKSPMSKMQWKKPPPKNNRQNKRLTEIDKLLMDEGAVNMIYQLTPEAPKGKKNMKTKAEFIKKIQSSTPDGKEMKFRERKKEGKCEEGEAKKIISGKPRTSMSSSVKSPMCDDFETHSADDSIIYRRHSSSSYSSSCMSPLRVNDVDGSTSQAAARLSRQTSSGQNVSMEEQDSLVDVFVPNTSHSAISNDIINKDDCLSIKQKLNNKLALALNKRKRDSIKVEKPPKQRRIAKSDESDMKCENMNFNNLTISFDHRLAEICIRKTGFICTVETVKELEKALAFVDSKSDISVTMLTSGCGTLCSGLDLRPLLVDSVETRTNIAYEIAESVRLLLCTMRRHSKLLCAGVWGPCTDVSLSMLALCDVTLASNSATFALVETQAASDIVAPLLPGVAVFTTECSHFPQSFVSDLVVFGRQLSATEALQGGLVSRTVWPERCAEQIRAIVQDLAAQPPLSIQLKKKLLSLKKNLSEVESTFLSCLKRERDLLIEYWTSVEGQDMIHSTVRH